jgi:(E)-4-hydroxy-3-methylbut-2-enyl-diphosphate synthase
MKRKNTITVNVPENVKIGGGNPVVIQSMTNTQNKDVEGTAEQIVRIYQAGAQIVRLTLPTISDLKYISVIRDLLKQKGYNIPLVADIHFSPKTALKAAAYFEKIRINPGNFAETNRKDIDSASYIKENLKPLVDYLKRSGKPLRVGVNHGSLSERMLEKYGDTEIGMVQSALEYIDILEEMDFRNIIVSLKATKPPVVVYANRLISSEFENRGVHYPLHLGVTEAGYDMDGRIKSAIGIGILLAEGIGDTIRVSLTEAPENEIKPAKIIVDYATKLLESSSLTKYYMPTGYNRMNVRKIAGIGGDEKPKVFWLSAGESKSEFNGDLKPDFIMKPQDDGLSAVEVDGNNAYSVYTKKNYGINSNEEKFMLVSSSDLDYNTIAKIKADGNTALIILFRGENPLEEQQKFYLLAKKFDLNVPFVFAREYDESGYEEFYIKAAIDGAYSFVNGMGNGILLVNNNFESSKIVEVAFKILQAAGVRINFTEYIACPSCGRTLFDIEKTTRQIEKATSHFKGIKIAIMGCIVNGLGEMADADCGYVGTKPGMISLYKNRTLVKKDIPQEQAVEELIRLIESDLNG